MKHVFDTRRLWRFVNKKINRAIHHYHVFGVMSILFDEIITDIKNNKEIKIHNFFTLSLRYRKPSHYGDVRTKEKKLNKGATLLKISFSPKFKKKLTKLIDLDKSTHDE